MDLLHSQDTFQVLLLTQRPCISLFPQFPQLPQFPQFPSIPSLFSISIPFPPSLIHIPSLFFLIALQDAHIWWQYFFKLRGHGVLGKWGWIGYIYITVGRAYKKGQRRRGSRVCMRTFFIPFAPPSFFLSVT
jgi:hypothetical protein